MGYGPFPVKPHATQGQTCSHAHAATTFLAGPGLGWPLPLAVLLDLRLHQFVPGAPYGGVNILVAALSLVVNELSHPAVPDFPVVPGAAIPQGVRARRRLPLRTRGENVEV